MPRQGHPHRIGLRSPLIRRRSPHAPRERLREIRHGTVGDRGKVAVIPHNRLRPPRCQHLLHDVRGGADKHVVPEERLDPQGEALVQHALDKVEKKSLAPVGAHLGLAARAAPEVKHLVAADVDVRAPRVEGHGLPDQLLCQLARARHEGAEAEPLVRILAVRGEFVVLKHKLQVPERLDERDHIEIEARRRRQDALHLSGAVVVLVADPRQGALERQHVLPLHHHPVRPPLRKALQARDEEGGHRRRSLQVHVHEQLPLEACTWPAPAQRPVGLAPGGCALRLPRLSMRACRWQMLSPLLSIPSIAGVAALLAPPRAHATRLRPTVPVRVLQAPEWLCQRLHHIVLRGPFDLHAPVAGSRVLLGSAPGLPER
mmetsp:Transcript_56764/g.179455  ORF Transcript_56764/g.179455 Transcript_56764/m.179455 type:complete len:373 (-) Transcript_56764:21-1139(-)